MIPATPKELLYDDPRVEKLCIHCGGTPYNEPCDTHYYTVEEDLQAQITELQSRLEQIECKRNTRKESKPTAFNTIKSLRDVFGKDIR